MSYQDVILNRERGGVEITINRPEKLDSPARTDSRRTILADLSMKLEQDRDPFAPHSHSCLGREKAPSPF